MKKPRKTGGNASKGYLISESTIAANVSEEVRNYMLRTWNGLEVKDADFDLPVQVLGVDYEHSKAKDMFDCAFIHAVKRAYGATSAIFTKSIAYVDMVMGDSVRKVYRFILTDAARRLIVRFDKAKNDPKILHGLPDGHVFVLRRPLSSKSLDAKKNENKKRDRSKPSRMLIRGEATCTPEASKKKLASRRKRSEQLAQVRRDKHGSIMMEMSDVRNAHGLIRFEASKVRPSHVKDAL
jgi:hypothetical protein